MLPKTLQRVASNLKSHSFLFEQLVKRDFKQRYKRTALGMAWSVLSPLMQLLVMMLVFKQLFGRNVDHYIIYLFSGNITMAYYKESTKNGMQSLMGNSSIISKINIPKYLFLLSKNVSALINYGLTIAIYFFFCIADGITFTPKMLMLWFPILCFVIMNLGIGMILSALFVFFRDIQYLYDIFLTLLQYLSVIFYTIDRFPVEMQQYFLLNPVYVNIRYWRSIVLDGVIPPLSYHALVIFYSLFFFTIGCIIYKKYNHRFIYYF